MATELEELDQAYQSLAAWQEQHRSHEVAGVVLTFCLAAFRIVIKLLMEIRENQKGPRMEAATRGPFPHEINPEFLG